MPVIGKQYLDLEGFVIRSAAHICKLKVVPRLVEYIRGFGEPCVIERRGKKVLLIPQEWAMSLIEEERNRHMQRWEPVNKSGKR